VGLSCVAFQPSARQNILSGGGLVGPVAYQGMARTVLQYGFETYPRGPAQAPAGCVFRNRSTTSNRGSLWCLQAAPTRPSCVGFRSAGRRINTVVEKLLTDEQHGSSVLTHTTSWPWRFRLAISDAARPRCIKRQAHGGLLKSSRPTGLQSHLVERVEVAEVGGVELKSGGPRLSEAWIA